MFFNSNDYPLDKEYRNRQMQTGRHLRQIGMLPATYRSFIKPTHRILFTTIFFLFAAMMMFSSSRVGASNDVRRANPDASPNASVQLALILGDFYFDNGEYAKAVVEFTKAIELMPEMLFELMPAQAIVFWQLGDAPIHAWKL